MEYRLSPEYIRMRKNGPRRVVIMLTVVMFIMGLFTFIGPAPHPNVSDAIVPFVITLLVVVAIGTFQIRGMRRAVEELAEVSVQLTDEGVTAGTSIAQNTLRYEAIQTVVIYRPWLKQEIRQILLKTKNSESGLPGLENAESFLTVLRQKLRNAQFHEKRSVFV